MSATRKTLCCLDGGSAAVPFTSLGLRASLGDTSSVSNALRRPNHVESALYTAQNCIAPEACCRSSWSMMWCGQVNERPSARCVKESGSEVLFEIPAPSGVIGMIAVFVIVPVARVDSAPAGRSFPALSTGWADICLVLRVWGNRAWFQAPRLLGLVGYASVHHANSSLPTCSNFTHHTARRQSTSGEEHVLP